MSSHHDVNKHDHIPVSLWLQDRIDEGIETEGSNLSGVSGRCSWEESSESSSPSHRGNVRDAFNEEDKENRIMRGDRRGSNDLDRPRISEYGEDIFKEVAL